MTDDDPTLESLQQDIDRLDTIAVRAIDRAKNAEDQAETLADRVAELEDLVDTLQSRVPERGVDEKLADLVEYAANKRDHQDVVAVSRDELKALWGCSRRYSYDLCDEDDGLPGRKAWILSPEELFESQYGNMEIDHGESHTKKIGIDFTGTTGIACPVNRFITQNSEKGGTA